MRWVMVNFCSTLIDLFYPTKRNRVVREFNFNSHILFVRLLFI